MTPRSTLISHLNQTGETQKQFADRVGVSPVSVYNFLSRGRIKREGTAIKKIKAALHKQEWGRVLNDAQEAVIERAADFAQTKVSIETEPSAMRTARLVSAVYMSDMSYQDKEEILTLLNQ